jgi:hypothetical protein
MDADRNVRERRELARRTSGSVEITLFWDAADDSTAVELWQPVSRLRLCFAVARERALDAFYHPFSHLAAASELLPTPDG